jgi:phosphatidylinositol alpha 1,6-mannosyltransferase
VLALTDPALRARMAATARPSVLRNTWSTVCDELLAHYAEVIGTPAAVDSRPTAA